LLKSDESPTGSVLLHDAVLVVFVGIVVVIRGLVNHVREHVSVVGCSAPIVDVLLANNGTNLLVVKLVRTAKFLENIIIDIARVGNTVALINRSMVSFVVRSEEHGPAATVTVSVPAVDLEWGRFEVVVTAMNPVDAVL